MQQQFQAQLDFSQTYVLAVSGGVDSVVMLDMLARIGGLKLIIAHFDHQIRGADSAADAQFVRQLARQYGLPYQLGIGDLSGTASEEQARKARYAFLWQVTEEVNGRLCTAHHQDDVLETIAINLTRGTGWRGLAVMGDQRIFRPMLMFTKQQLINYATNYNLQWREDATNQSDRYLRNQLRKRLQQELSDQANQLLMELYHRQNLLVRGIKAQCQLFYQPSGRYQRYFWIMIDLASAQELLNFIVKRDFGVSLTRPQLQRALVVIKVARPRTAVAIGENLQLNCTRREFWFSQLN